MKITVLVENTTNDVCLGCEHGLSLYIETDKHRILFDSGDSDLFEKNAQQLHLDLSSVDMFILSHGHHDHGGGLYRFLEINHSAKIYAHQKAFEPHYSKRGEAYVNIGVPFPPNLGNRLIMNSSEMKIDDELMLFSKISGRKYYPTSNNNLYRNENNHFVHDDFRHEQNLIITAHHTNVLVAGCAHHGMLNIIHQATHIIQQPIGIVIGGLHLYSRSTGISESEETVKDIGNELLNTNTILLTCHCTGETAYALLKPIMHDHIGQIKTGSVIMI